MDTHTTTAINTLLREQLGHITRDQLDRAGMPRSTLRRREERGELIRVGRRTWRAASAPASSDGRIVAACLDTGGVASHWTAAMIHGLVMARLLIDVTVPRSRSRSLWLPPAARASVRLHSTTSLPPADITVVRGILTTSVARTLMMVGALVPHELTQEQLAEMLARACEIGRASERWLFWLLEQRREHGRNGTIAFEEALASRVQLGPTESWLERETLRVIAEAGLPLPRVQQRVDRRGRFVGRVDMRYDEWPVVIESLGYAHHRSRADLERDTRRVNEMQLAGLTVLQFSYDQVVRDPGSVQDNVAEAIGFAHRRAA